MCDFFVLDSISIFKDWIRKGFIITMFGFFVFNSLAIHFYEGIN